MGDRAVAYSLVASPDHTMPGHPENAGRFRHFGRLEQAPFAARLSALPARPATDAELAAVHPPRYLAALREAIGQAPAVIDYAPTYVTPASQSAAWEAAGAVLALTEAVAGGAARAAFALVRPPGHHATPVRAMGFCLLNNAALAARRAQTLGFRRVLIADFDVHHGNGTQEAFEADPEVLYLSTHQSGIYPGTGALDDSGPGEGRGTVANLPLPSGAGDRAFGALTERLLVPLARRFEPDFIVVSAGYDAHWRDPLAGLQLSAAGYYDLAAALVGLAEELCGGRILFTLEGGYDPQALAGGVLASLAALCGAPAPADELGPAPHPEPEIGSLLEAAARLHAL